MYIYIYMCLDICQCACGAIHIYICVTIHMYKGACVFKYPPPSGVSLISRLCFEGVVEVNQFAFETNLNRHINKYMFRKHMKWKCGGKRNETLLYVRR